MYLAHPDLSLRAAFERKPFQGADPRRATFLFVGLDANYADDAATSGAFKRILEYHEDGVTFWHRHGVHHPFLLPTYRGDGRRYHLNFARIGFSPAHADQVSFVELLHVPTVGRSKLEVEDLDVSHLSWLDAAIRGGQARHILVSASVERLMRSSGAFPWLGAAPSPFPSVLPVVWTQGDRTIYRHLHFSNYGKFQRQMDLEARAIASLCE
jgi:hypothetical protein